MVAGACSYCMREVFVCWGFDILISVFMSYSHKDEDLRNELETRLAMLKREGIVDVWHDRRIVPGEEIDPAISVALEEAQLILLLVSPDFLASDYCHDKEMRRAMERHEAGEAKVLPVILRHCDWKNALFGKLLVTPKDGKPVKKWADIDEAFQNVTQDIRHAIKAMTSPSVPEMESPAPDIPASLVGATAGVGPRSSNLRVRQSFTEAEKDRFLNDAFEYMAKFFEGSLEELKNRNPEIEISFKRIDARRFTAVVYRGGNAISRCQVFLGGMGRKINSILYSMSDAPSDGGFNESLSMEEGEQMLGLRSLGMWRGGGTGREQRLTFEGAAEHYWSILMEPLQR